MDAKTEKILISTSNYKWSSDHCVPQNCFTWRRFCTARQKRDSNPRLESQLVTFCVVFTNSTCDNKITCIVPMLLPQSKNILVRLTEDPNKGQKGCLASFTEQVGLEVSKMNLL